MGKQNGDMIFGSPEWLVEPLPGLAPESLRAQRLDDALRECREIAKRGHHGLSLKDINVAESYVAGDPYIRLIAAPLDRPFGSKVRYYNAFFKVAGSRDNEADLCIADDKVLHNAWSADRANGDEIAVLVHVAQTTESPEAIVPSLVRLEVHDRLLNVGGDTDEFSLLSLDGLSLPFNIFGSSSEGKVDVLHVVATCISGNSDHELVETGPQVVDRFGGQQKQAVRDAARHLDFGEAVTRIGVRLDDKVVSISTKDTCDLPFDLIDVRVGPINLDARTT